MLDKEALSMLVDYVEQAANGLDAVYAIIDKLETGAGQDCGQFVCDQAVRRCIRLVDQSEYVIDFVCRWPFPHYWPSSGGSIAESRQWSSRSRSCAGV